MRVFVLKNLPLSEVGAGTIIGKPISVGMKYSGIDFKP
jgi:hypothetical protein